MVQLAFIACTLAVGGLPNTWVRVAEGGTEGRSSPGLVWVGAERCFVCLGGRMGMQPKDRSPYSELTLNLQAGRWENRFPKDKLGVWGELVGPSRAPAFPGSYYAVAMLDVEGNVRPYLGAGYDRAMYLYNNCAWDSDRGLVVVAWHLGALTAEYDPVRRTWRVVETAKDAPAEFWDDCLWGAMCYDGVNKEVLGGRGRWACSARAGRWRRLEFRNKLLDGLRARAETLRTKAQDLVGACRSRYWLSETPAEAAARLDEQAGGIVAGAAALADELTSWGSSATGQDALQLSWARQEQAAARTALGKAAELLGGRITPEAIARVEDARDLLERCALALAVEPPPRAFSPMVYDPAHRKIVMFGGDRLDRRLADTWVYDCPTRTWRQRRPKVSPPPRAGHGLAWLPGAGKVLLVDGYGIGDVGQCWVYDTAKDEWALLAEGDPKRPALTPRPSYTWLPGPLAAGPDDTVVMISRGEPGRAGSRSNGTWAAKIDASRIDAAGTARLGVGPLTMSEVSGITNPRWYEQTGPPPDEADGRKLDHLPANTWVGVTPPNGPKANRAWGTTVLDSARDQIIQWGGGHAAYSGNDVLHYSIRTNRCSTGSSLPEFALNWNASMIFPPRDTTLSGRPWAQHTYHNYGFDSASGKVIAYSRSAGQFFRYDPHTRDWKGRIGRRFARPTERAWIDFNYNTTCVPTPKGLAAWVPGEGLLRLDAATMTWRPLPVKGKLPEMSVDNQGLAYDSRRGRFLMFTKALKGDVATCDAATGEVGLLKPAGTGAIDYRPRETVYVEPADAVLVGHRLTPAGGRTCWLVYDCARDAWLGVDLPGGAPQVGFGLGLMYDPKRKCVWAAGSRLELSVLRLNLQTASTRPIEAEPAK